MKKFLYLRSPSLGFVDYFVSQIRTGSPPSFRLPSNENNRIPVAGADKPGLHPHQDLARVLNLTGLRRVFKRNLDRSTEFVAVQDSRNFDDDFPKWLDDKCGDSEAARERFLDATVQVLNHDRLGHPYQPAWVTLWEDFRRFAASGPTRWQQGLGLRPQAPGPAWLIVLRYKVYEASPIYRPTQLDADWNGYHWVSPEQSRLENGGYALDLAEIGGGPVREYVHGQVDLRLGHWVAAGSLIGKAEWADPMGLPAQRQRQHDSVVATHGEEARWWRY